jgi:hypothetical protein
MNNGAEMMSFLCKSVGRICNVFALVRFPNRDSREQGRENAGFMI